MVHYTESATQTFNQSLSDWGSAQHYPGEWIIATMNHRDVANGTTQGLVTYLYQYSFPLNNSKLISGVTLPNNTNVIVMAALVTISPTNTAPTLAAISDRTITADSTITFTNSASDADQPPQRLTFNLTAGPAGSKHRS